MKLFDLVNELDLRRGIADKLIKVRESGDGQRILNYTDAAMRTPGAWDNPAVRICRGLIIDEQENIVARPWAKFFNHGQAEAGQLDMYAPVEVTDKMDGSLGILHVAPDGRPRIATRGSFHSEQAIHATGLLPELLGHFSPGYTFLFEIIYPENRIVCDYGNMDDLVLLGAVDIETGAYIGPHHAQWYIRWDGQHTEYLPFGTLREALAAPPRKGAEGMCVRFINESRIVKVKQEEYIRLHRIVTGLSERSVWERMMRWYVREDRSTLHDLLDEIPDELHEWVRSVWYGLELEVEGIASRASDTHRVLMALHGYARKAYALAAQQHPQLRPYLFLLLDGKDPKPAILRSLKPAGDTRALVRTEDVA